MLLHNIVSQSYAYFNLELLELTQTLNKQKLNHNPPLNICVKVLDFSFSKQQIGTIW